MDYCDITYCDPAYTEHDETYLSLITSEHANKPKFMALVGASVQPLENLQSFLGTLQDEFDIDTARWNQLDMIGARIGLDRNLRSSVPGVYSPALPAGSVPLADSDYQVLIRGKIASNQWDGTVSGAYAGLMDIFGEGSGSSLFIQDNQDMSIYVCVAGNVPSAGFKAALSGGYMQVRPAGVTALYVYPTAPGGALFGFDVSNEFIQGFDSGVIGAST